jgi:26S proteasome regulatory subunit N1
MLEALESGERGLHPPVILGLGIAYAGQNREDIQEVLVPIVVNSGLPLCDRAFAALSLGMIFVGKCNDEVASAIIENLIECSERDMEDPLAKYFAVGLGLIFLGQQSRCNNTLEAVQVVQGPMSRYFQVTIEGLAYAGTGNVLKMQEMMHICMESEPHSELAVVSMALIAAGEEIGNEMCHRIINHLLHYGSLASKKMVSLAIALLNLSNPKVPVIDLLAKLCHDPNAEIANRAVLALGLASAGSNNSRVAELLRGFARYFEPNGLFCVRIAQGLLYMGKGTMTIQPYHSEKFLMNKVAMAGVVTFVHSLVEVNATVLGKHHYLMFSLSLGMYPKMLFIVTHSPARRAPQEHEDPAAGGAGG